MNNLFQYLYIENIWESTYIFILIFYVIRILWYFYNVFIFEKYTDIFADLIIKERNLNEDEIEKLYVEINALFDIRVSTTMMNILMFWKIDFYDFYNRKDYVIEIFNCVDKNERRNNA